MVEGVELRHTGRVYRTPSRPVMQQNSPELFRFIVNTLKNAVLAAPTWALLYTVGAEPKINNFSSATLCGTIEGFKTFAGINVESVFLG